MSGRRIFGLSFFSRASNGEMVLVSYHPRGSKCWHWSAALCRSTWGPAGKWFYQRQARRDGQWHDYLRVSPRWAIRISQQNYHKERKSA